MRREARPGLLNRPDAPHSPSYVKPDRNGPPDHVVIELANVAILEDAVDAINVRYIRRSQAGLKRYRCSRAHRPLDFPNSNPSLFFYLRRSEIVDHLPKSPTAHAELGQQLFLMAKNDEAGAELQKVIDLDAKCARAWFYLGRVRAAKGDQAGAKEAYEKARADSLRE